MTPDDYSRQPPAHSSITQDEWKRFLNEVYRYRATGVHEIDLTHTEHTWWGSVIWAPDTHPVAIVVANPALPVTVAHRAAGAITQPHISFTPLGTMPLSERGLVACGATFFGSFYALPHVVPSPEWMVASCVLSAAAYGVTKHWQHLRNRHRKRWQILALDPDVDPADDGFLSTVEALHSLTETLESLHPSDTDPSRIAEVHRVVRGALWSPEPNLEPVTPLETVNSINQSLNDLIRAKHQRDAAVDHEIAYLCDPPSPATEPDDPHRVEARLRQSEEHQKLLEELDLETTALRQVAHDYLNPRPASLPSGEGQ